MFEKDIVSEQERIQAITKWKGNNIGVMVRPILLVNQTIDPNAILYVIPVLQKILFQP